MVFPALLLASVITLTSTTECIADSFSEATAEGTAPRHLVPSEYGQVIYRKNAESPKQLYIIGQSHRSAITGQNSEDIIKVQAEIFRIGEWLIQEQNVGMLLPEGFFKKLTPGEDSAPAEVVRENVGLDNQTLETRLGEARFVNADMLLNANYNIPLGQVENEELYRTIRGLLQKATRKGDLSVLPRIHGLQGERTIVMLQNIPDTVEEAVANGRISQHRAIFTIGLNHVGEIIDILKKGRLPSREHTDLSAGEMMGEAGLKLLEQGYGVTVIIPKTLAENEDFLRLARLEIN